MERLAPGVSFFDLYFQRRPRVIAAVVLHDAAGITIVDPGPASTLPTLHAALSDAGIEFGDVRAIALTHIHLDHAGATGTLVAEHPHLKVFVHRTGASHLVDPSRLLSSAGRLYGDAMDRLWGEVRPVPQHALVAVDGGETLSLSGRSWNVAYTPGHASHHVSYFNADSGIALVGDVAGVKLQPSGFVLPPTPPPDIDLELWKESLRRIERLGPRTLFVTHFGPYADPAAHLEELRDHLELVARLARESLEQPGDDEARAIWFRDQVMSELRKGLDENDARGYEVAARSDLNWRGLARYWRKKQASV
ncbi:MAG TPA: MBL fold metallo-hydrolase [Vicinamibacterales bacterium]|nr:MBL fold metallo-hydrolase [Vicinamibacterales bacterium]